MLVAHARVERKLRTQGARLLLAQSLMQITGGIIEIAEHHGLAAVAVAGLDTGGRLAPIDTMHAERARLHRTFAARHVRFLVGDALVYERARPIGAVSYTHLRAHETRHDLVCRL